MAGKIIFAGLPVLEAERLLLRRMRPEDAEAMLAYVPRTLSDGILRYHVVRDEVYGL